MKDLRVGQMRANLQARGYSGIDNPDPDQYDDGIIAVVAHFQRRNGLDDDGVAGPKTIAAMNVTAGERVSQIIVNMERWRWLPDELGSRHVFVNQAGFEMFLVDKGEVVGRHKVIVGKPFHKTPMFSDKIAYAEFNPTWTVTPAIAEAEFLPKLRADPGYLGRNDYVLYGGWGAGAPVIDPWSVDWNAVGGKKFPYRIVQSRGRRTRSAWSSSCSRTSSTSTCTTRRPGSFSPDRPRLQPWLHPRARTGELRRKAVRPRQFADPCRHQEADRLQEDQDGQPEEQGARPSHLLHRLDRR